MDVVAACRPLLVDTGINNERSRPSLLPQLAGSTSRQCFRPSVVHLSRCSRINVCVVLVDSVGATTILLPWRAGTARCMAPQKASSVCKDFAAHTLQSSPPSISRTSLYVRRGKLFSVTASTRLADGVASHRWNTSIR